MSKNQAFVLSFVFVALASSPVSAQSTVMNSSLSAGWAASPGADFAADETAGRSVDASSASGSADSPAGKNAAPTGPALDSQKGATAAGAAQSRTDYLDTRWYDFSTVQLRVRSKFIENSAGVTTANQFQYAPQIVGRIKLDAAARFTVNFNVTSGTSFVGGWNATGIGTPSVLQGNFNFKQLYFAAVPVKGVELQVGGLGFARGAATEITTYDNDGYLVGERIDVKRPHSFYFDDVSVTVGYLGDLKQPSVFPRLHRELGRTNYGAYLVQKNIGKRVVASEEFVNQWGVHTLHSAFGVSLPETRAVDKVHVEIYDRLNTDSRRNGAAVWGEKALTKRFGVSGGYINIDPNYGGLNSDDYDRGQRMFVIGDIKVSYATSFQLFYTHAFSNPFPVSLNDRFDVRFKVDFIKLIQGQKHS